MLQHLACHDIWMPFQTCSVVFSASPASVLLLVPCMFDGKVRKSLPMSISSYYHLSGRPDDRHGTGYILCGTYDREGLYIFLEFGLPLTLDGAHYFHDLVPTPQSSRKLDKFFCLAFPALESEPRIYHCTLHFEEPH